MDRPALFYHPRGFQNVIPDLIGDQSSSGLTVLQNNIRGEIDPVGPEKTCP